MKKPKDLVSWNIDESDRNLKKPKHTSNPKRTKFWDDIPLSPIQDHNNKNYTNSIDETKLK
ncbi:hypothetical protein A0H76_2624 [Hepatospora eriocheir]|uniref:Uncharacterized protein n=1 Tax=Hepatospora eriocheir TaxID=1081669 RepID=A0A1X0QJJ2_9MICR|nr:hypothetical protein A0H76_2624 [Hepatospora eriocheir]